MTNPTKIVLSIFALIFTAGLVITTLSPVQIHRSYNNEDKQAYDEIKKATTYASKRPLSTLPILSEKMPDFVGISHWWNTPNNAPLHPADLIGKVVLVDFWTYSCINCIRTYPFIRAMQEKYADKGLVIISVHTPEFAFEKNPDNVGAEIIKNNLKHAIALDPEFATWNAYENHYWPAEYFFDTQGRLRHTHFGEGEYDQSEQVIRDLLAEVTKDDLGKIADLPTPDFSAIATPETYFGLSRGNAFSGIPGHAGQEIQFHTVATLQANMWSASGTWIFNNENIENSSANAIFKFNVQSNKLHIVMESADKNDKKVSVYVDGVFLKDIVINTSTLYTVAEFIKPGRHIVELRLTETGVRLFAATFS